jgi:hypothetical protein
VTDAAGRFTLSGFGRERIVVLRLSGPTIATRFVNVITRVGPAVRGTRPRPSGPLAPPASANDGTTYDYAQGATFDYAAAPGVAVEGTVRDQDSRKPLAGVIVRQQISDEFGAAEDEVKATTDASGHYRLDGLSRPVPGLYHGIHFAAPANQAYLTAAFPQPGSGSDRPARLDIALKRGVLVKGRVTDKATGQPVQGIVEYRAFADNPHIRDIKGFEGSQVVTNSKDGSFLLPALPGRGIMAARTDEMRRGQYLSAQGADAIEGVQFNAALGGRFFETRPLCSAFRFDTLAEIKPDVQAESVVCDLQLDPGKTVKGTLVDPDGKPLAGVSIRGADLSLRSLRALPSAAFAIPAVDPQKPEAYFFEHPEKNLAAAVIVDGSKAAGLTVKLKPTATLTGRLVTEDGEPLRNTYVQGYLEGGQLKLARPWNGFFYGRTDTDGRFTIKGLLAGVKLGASDARGTLFKNLTLRPGEVRDLGDVKRNRLP